MPVVTVQELIDAGVHFGHQASRWNPKMKPFIYGKRHKIHVINLKETVRGLYQGCHFLRHLATTGAQIMFLGTKRQIRAVVGAEAARCGMPAITERWIGGTLTNFNTVREQLTRLEELEAMEADGSMERHKKKAQATLRREMRKIQRNLEGVRDLHGLPGGIIVVDPRREDITMREATKMNVPVVAILDTDCNPDLADIVIPGNDDAMSSVQLLLSRLTDAIIEGRASMDEQSALTAQRMAAEDPRAREVGGRRMQGDRPQSRGRLGGGRPGGGGGGRPMGAGARGGGRPAGPGARPGGGGGRGRPIAPPGGRLGRKSTGRFADKAGGHADSVTVGGTAEDLPSAAEISEARAASGTPVPATGAPPATGPAPATDAAPATGAAPAATPPADAAPAAEPTATEPTAAEPTATEPTAPAPDSEAKAADETPGSEKQESETKEP